MGEWIISDQMKYAILLFFTILVSIFFCECFICECNLRLYSKKPVIVEASIWDDLQFHISVLVWMFGLAVLPLLVLSYCTPVFTTKPNTPVLGIQTFSSDEAPRNI